ncbi:peroxisomal membrane protein PEX14 isoform X2 [Eucalyptus grandis]|uniref:peroxisomal membrane protein PEX14 isoform X2 n=1 Tax=Eucalyptus grandis TaxID=71139 RepID=UPI00192ED72D|nr:peroxisomal membrane protein PEX14 isoform X2 [Eucalyptus grandis]
MATGPDDKPQESGTELAKPTNEAPQNAAADNVKSTSTPSVFVNSEPIREEQVQNAVKFLSHPKVQGSPVIYRRSFLERKGLTKEEIDEAFRRVPDPTPSAQPTNVSPDPQSKSSANVQPQSSSQALQPAAAAPAGVISSVVTTTRPRFRWIHAAYAVGFLAVSGAGTAVLLKNAIIPRFKCWIRKVISDEENDVLKRTNAGPSLEEETAAAAKAAAAAAADVAKVSQEMLNSKVEERKYFGELVKLLDVQLQEMKSMSTAIQKLEGHANTSGALSQFNHEDHGGLVTIPKPFANGRAEFESRSGGYIKEPRSSSPPGSSEPSAAPHPKSYMEIMAMVQRGERPPNVKDINDSPPNPHQQIPNPRLAPRAKPWETIQTQNNSSNVYQYQSSAEAWNYNAQDNGITDQSNGDASAPWWQRKNARITEIDRDEDLKTGQPVQRAWVPPQPPPIAMAEAAEAIRRPKPAAQKEQSSDETASRSSDVTDELQKITKFSESGGAESTSEMSSGMNLTEIQVEQE